MINHFSYFCHSHFFLMNVVFGKLVLDRIIAKLVEGRARDKQWRVGSFLSPLFYSLI